jgi:DNA-binding transcriptional regulator/RsmH inhibitor MraZ
MLIPAKLREDLGLKGDVVVIGNNTSIEIWSKDSWQAMEKELEQSIEEIEFGEGVDL